MPELSAIGVEIATISPSVNGAAAASALSSHTSSTANPHSTTAAQIKALPDYDDVLTPAASASISGDANHFVAIDKAALTGNVTLSISPWTSQKRRHFVQIVGDGPYAVTLDAGDGNLIGVSDEASSAHRTYVLAGSNTGGELVPAHPDQEGDWLFVPQRGLQGRQGNRGPAGSWGTPSAVAGPVDLTGGSTTPELIGAFALPSIDNRSIDIEVVFRGYENAAFAKSGRRTRLVTVTRLAGTYTIVGAATKRDEVLASGFDFTESFAISGDTLRALAYAGTNNTRMEVEFKIGRSQQLTTSYPTAESYSLSGPESGDSGSSLVYTVALPSGQQVTSDVIVTFAQDGSGTFSPATVTFEANTPSDSHTTTFTPTSIGTINVSTTNSGTLTDPDAIAVSVTAPQVATFVAVDAGRIYFGLDPTSTPSEIAPTGTASNQAWRAAASSSDGSRRLAGIGSGRLYRYASAAWAEAASTAGGADRAWTCAAISATTGQYQFAGTSSGGAGILYRSSDYGETWAASGAASDYAPWNHVAVSADGSTVLAVGDANKCALSTDHGSTWSLIHPDAAYSEYVGCAASANGSVLACTQYGYKVFTSTDRGTTWAETNIYSVIESQATHVCMSADGTKMYVASLNGKLAKSTNTGGAFSLMTIAALGNTAQTYAGIACDPTGQYVWVAISGGRMFRSSDYGTSWSEVQPGGANNLAWKVVQ